MAGIRKLSMSLKSVCSEGVSVHQQVPIMKSSVTLDRAAISKAIDGVFSDQSCYWFSDECLRLGHGKPVDDLLDVLRADASTALFDISEIQLGNCFTSTSIDALGSWLIDQTRKFGVTKSLDRLEAFLGGSSTPTIQFALLQGIRVPTALSLSAKVSIVPIEEIPSIEYLKAFAKVQGKIQRESLFDLFENRMHVNVAPQSALLVRYETPGTLKPRPAELSDFLAAGTGNPNGDLDDAIGFLPLLGPSGPFVVGKWTEVDDGVPLKGYVFGAYEEFRPGHTNPLVVELTPENMAKAPGDFEVYLAAGAQHRAKLRVATQRLGMACGRRQPVDQAIDLGIALESLLLEDAGKDAQIALTFRLRGAYLVGGADLAERQYLERIFNKLYELRSTAVHRGIVEEGQFNVGKKRGDAALFLSEGLSLCAAAILKTLEMKRFPDWTRMMLGGQP